MFRANPDRPNPYKKQEKAVTSKLTLSNFENEETKSKSRVNYGEQNFKSLHKTGIYPVAENFLI